MLSAMRSYKNNLFLSFSYIIFYFFKFFPVKIMVCDFLITHNYIKHSSYHTIIALKNFSLLLSLFTYSITNEFKALMTNNFIINLGIELPECNFKHTRQSSDNYFLFFFFISSDKLFDFANFSRMYFAR